MSSPAMSSPVQGASSRGSPARGAASSSPGVVNPTDSPPVPGTPHSARSAPRTPASGIVAPTPGSAAQSGAGGRRSASLQPSPNNRSDLGRGSSQVRAAAGSQGEEAGSGSGNNPNTLIWGTDIQVSETKAAARKFFKKFVAEGEEEPKYMKLLEQAYMRGANFINLDCGHVRSFDSSIYDKLVRFPTEAITILDVVLTELYSEEYQYRSDFVEVSIVSRPFNLEDTSVMRDLNPADVDKLVSIKGMIIRRSVFVGTCACAGDCSWLRECPFPPLAAALCLLPALTPQAYAPSPPISSAIVPDIQRAYFECSTCKGAEEVDIVNGRIAEPTKVSLSLALPLSPRAPLPPFSLSPSLPLSLSSSRPHSLPSPLPRLRPLSSLPSLLARSCALALNVYSPCTRRDPASAASRLSAAVLRYCVYCIVYWN